MTPHAQTLAQRLAAGRLSQPDALRCGLQIVDALRHAHEEGHAHGALTPASVALLTAGGVEVMPAPANPPVATGYTSPEQIAGRPADQRSDIFSLGAILYEMFTGRRAFPGETPEDCIASIEHSTPIAIGDTALDRLVFNCLVKDPAGRWQRAQQVHMELKIVLFSHKRAQAPLVLRAADTALLAEVRHLSTQLPRVDAQLSSRLEQQASETTAALRQVAAELPVIEAHLNARLEERFREAVARSAVPELESRVAEVEQQSVESTASIRELAAELPQLESRLVEQTHEVKASVARLTEESPQLQGRVSQLEQQSVESAASIRQINERLPQLEARLAEQTHEVKASVALLTAESPQLQGRVAQLEEQSTESAASIRQLTEQLPQLEARLAEQTHEVKASAVESAASVRQLTEQLPQLEARLAEQTQEMSARIEALAADAPQWHSRLEKVEEQAAESATVRRVAGELPLISALIEECTRELAADSQRLAQLESQSAATAESMRQASAELPQIESHLRSLFDERSKEAATRLEQHEEAIAGLREAVAAPTKPNPEVAACLEQQNAVLEVLQSVTTEQKSALEATSGTVSALQTEMAALAGKLAAIEDHAERSTQSAETQVALFAELQSLGLTVQSHAAAIESIRASLARADDFMERVVEALESLQTMVLEQARDRVVA